MLVLTRHEVEALLDLDALVDALAAAMVELSAGRVSLPPRVAALVPEQQGLLGVMPAHVPALGVLETKLVSLFPNNAGSALPTHQAVIAAFDPANGTPIALMDATYITEARTAAGSALATRLLAREDAAVLALLGTGVQARAHARAIPRVRPIREIRVAGRDLQKAERFAQDLSASFGIPARATATYPEAVAGADVICACTHAVEPVVRREWLSSGVHVNSVGLNGKGREVDAETVRDSLLVVESRMSVLAPFPAGANDITWPVRDGTIGEDHIHAEIGEIVAGSRPGRSDPGQITLYKSVGVGVQDAAAVALVLEAARAAGAGVNVEI